MGRSLERQSKLSPYQVPSRPAARSGSSRFSLQCSRALFDFNQFNLKPDAAAVLSGIKSALLDRYPNSPLTVEGYTDDVGSVPYNLKLSRNRADPVAQWMLQQGIAPARVTPVGYGKTKLRYPNTGEETRPPNHRVAPLITLNTHQPA